MKKNLLWTLLVGNVLTLSAQPLSDSIASSFHLLEQIPQEKLYLHLDKPYYSAGEKLWFKGYLVNATTHQEDLPDNYILAELINQSDSVILRKKIRKDTLGVFSNAFELPPTLPAGNYYLRAYTDYMRNVGNDFFYSRNLKIGNPLVNDIQTSIQYLEKEALQYTAEITFKDDKQKPLSGIEMRYRYSLNEGEPKRGRVKTDKQGRVTIPLANITVPAKRRLDVEFDDLVYMFKQTFYPPTVSKQFDVTFFPEGGALLAVKGQRIAFKAQGSDGYSRAVSGTVLNAAGDTILNFQSEHDGMGMFTLPLPKAGETYYVDATSNEGTTKRFHLPKVEASGVVLSLAYSKKAIYYEVQQTENTPWQPLLLVGHTRGKLSVLHPIEKENVSGIVLTEQLQSGIAHFMLVDQQGNVISERLLFVPDQAPHQLKIATDKPSYGAREKVTLQLSAKDIHNLPVEGNFSISITNRATVQPDSLADNILSNLLVTSDLKGYIENPGYYFLNQNSKTLRHLDLVMMTHGWRRHHITNVAKIVPPAIKYYMEEGQIISGRVDGLWGGDVKEGMVTLLNPRNKAILTATTDDKGRFLFSTFFRDGSPFMVQAHTQKGSAKVGIEMDSLSFPQPQHKGVFSKENIVAKAPNYLTAAREQYYIDGGERVYNLKEVLVTARRNNMSSRTIYSGSDLSTPTVTAKDIERSGAETALQATVMRLPGLTIQSDE
ncbi:MAG: TonB-dependent receptor, partial [Prevotellaceae bacterium]|nr:TonB-dependent receptor [Prevotellaceae bacterium]